MFGVIVCSLSACFALSEGFIGGLSLEIRLVFCVFRRRCRRFCVVGFAFVMSHSPECRVGRFACFSCLSVLRVDLKLVVVRCFVVIVCLLLVVLGVLFLPISERSGFLALCVSALAGVVVLAVDIRICCLCRSLSALLSVL